MFMDSKTEMTEVVELGIAEQIERVELQLAELKRQEQSATENQGQAASEVARLSHEIGSQLIVGADVSHLQSQLAAARTQLEATQSHVDAIPRHRKPLEARLEELRLRAAKEKLEGLEADTVTQLTAYVKKLLAAYETAEPLIGTRLEVDKISRNHMNVLQPKLSTFDLRRLVAPLEDLLASIEQIYPWAVEAANTSVQKRELRRKVQNYPKTLPRLHR